MQSIFFFMLVVFESIYCPWVFCKLSPSFGNCSLGRSAIKLRCTFKAALKLWFLHIQSPSSAARLSFSCSAVDQSCWKGCWICCQVDFSIGWARREWVFEARSEVPGESAVDVWGTNWSIEAFTVNCWAFYCFSMSGVSELLFRHDTMDCFTETCLNHEQYGSLMAPYAENDDLEVFFLSLQSCRFLMCRYALLEPEEPHLLTSLPCLTSTCQCIDIVQL